MSAPAVENALVVDPEGFTEAGEWLSERFEDVRAEPGRKGWTARCPICPIGYPRRFSISWPAYDMGACTKGHTADAIRKATQPREPGEDDADGERRRAPCGWGFEWLEDFMVREFPPARWIYLDLVQAETTCVIVAPPNSGKTLLAFDLGAQIVAAAVKAKEGLRAAIVENEGSARAFQGRLARAFAAAGGRPVRAVKVCWNADRDLTDPAALVELAAECRGADIIVLDSLADLSPATDENDSKEMKQLAAALRTLQRLSGATVIALHHLTKEAWKPGETPSLRHLRGHGALAGKVDTVLALVPGHDEPGKVNFDLFCLKQRDGEKAPPRHVSVCMTGPAATVEMTSLERKEREGGAKRGGTSKIAADAGLKSRVLLKLQERPDSGSGVARRLGIRKDDSLKICAQLEEEGAVCLVGQKYHPATVPTVPAVPSGSPEPVAASGSRGSHPLKGGTATGTDPGTDPEKSST